MQIRQNMTIYLARIPLDFQTKGVKMKVLLNALMVLAVFSTLACGSAECEGGGCRDKIKSHGKARGR